MLAVLVCAVLVLCYIVSTTVKPKNFPPGPRWYPFFGCNNILHSRIAKYGSQWKVISEMAKEYSTDILGLKMGDEKVVVVFGDKNIRQVANEKEFDGRPDSFFLRLRTYGKRIGITFVDGPVWKEHRLFAFKSMRNEGLGKLSMHEDIQAALNIIINYINGSNGSPINLKTMVAMSVMNIIWKYAAGEHIKEHEMRKIVELLSARSKVSTLAGGWLNQCPWLRFIAPEWSGYNVNIRVNEQICKVIEESISKHKDASISKSDYMQSFLNEMYQRKDINESVCYTEDQLKGVCTDIIIASAQTTGSTFDFAILAAIHHMDMQEKIYQEICSVFGDNDFIWTDSVRLVYTSAFIAEVQRYYTIAPFSAPRRTVVDVDIGGYTIPEGTTILVSLGDLHMDPDLWEEPKEFRPERFIDSNGSLKNSVNSHPFGIGRRKCPGETLAKPFLLTALTEIIRRYRIEACNGVLPSDEPVIGMLTEPRPFVARFIKRNLHSQ